MFEYLILILINVFSAVCLLRIVFGPMWSRSKYAPSISQNAINLSSRFPQSRLLVLRYVKPDFRHVYPASSLRRIFVQPPSYVQATKGSGLRSCVIHSAYPLFYQVDCNDRNCTLSQTHLIEFHDCAKTCTRSYALLYLILAQALTLVFQTIVWTPSRYQQDPRPVLHMPVWSSLTTVNIKGSCYVFCFSINEEL